MGLDMYLSARRYIGAWDHGTGEEKKQYDKITAAAGLKGFRCEDSPHLYVEISVAYWRKANAVHRWFVEKVQGGKDECQCSYVEREQLQELVAACKRVLGTVETVEGDIHNGSRVNADGSPTKLMEPGTLVAQPGIAAAVLPTASGFFFGSTDYDQYYLEDLKDTVKQLEAVLKDKRFEGFDFRYHASW